MATSDLITKSLGGVEVQSGSGIPDHVAPKGSLYTNTASGSLYVNKDSSSGWTVLSRCNYGDMYMTGYTTQTTIGTSNWVIDPNLPLWYEELAGFDFVSGYTLQLQSGYDGLYNVMASVTLAYVAVANYQIGISVNGSDPVAGHYNGTYLSGTGDVKSIPVNFDVSLTAGDYITIAVRNITSTTNVIIRHATVTVNRIGD